MNNLLIDPYLLSLSQHTPSAVITPVAAGTITETTAIVFSPIEITTTDGPASLESRDSSASINETMIEVSLECFLAGKIEFPRYNQTKQQSPPTPVPSPALTSAPVTAAPAATLSTPPLPLPPTPGPRNSSLSLRAHLAAAGITDNRNRHNFAEASGAEELRRIRNANAVRRCRARRAEAQAAGKELPATGKTGRPSIGNGRGKKGRNNHGIASGRVTKLGENRRKGRNKAKGTVDGEDEDEYKENGGGGGESYEDDEVDGL